MKIVLFSCKSVKIFYLFIVYILCYLNCYGIIKSVEIVIKVGGLMSKIRWKESDKISLKKQVRNYNAKMKRLAKKGYDIGLLPEKRTYKELIKNITTREQLKTEMKLMTAFTKKGSEKTTKTTRGGIIPNFSKEQIRIQLSVINKQRREMKKMYENVEATDRSIGTGQKVKNFDTVIGGHIKERKANFDRMSNKEFALFKESLLNYNESIEEKNEQYRENLYKAIDKNFSLKQANDIKSVMNQINTNDIVYKYYTDLNMDIDFVYDQTDQTLKYEETLDAWNRLLKEKQQQEQEKR